MDLESVAKWLARAQEDPGRANLRMLGLALYKAADHLDGWSRDVADRVEAAGGVCRDAARGRVPAAAALQVAATALEEARAV